MSNRTRDELLGIAKQRLAVIVGESSVSNSAVPEVMALLEQIVEDGQPIPQPTGTPDNIEVGWIVNSWYVGFIVIRGEGWILWGEQPDRTELFEVESGPGMPLKPIELGWTQHLLKAMGDQLTDSGMWKI